MHFGGGDSNFYRYVGNSAVAFVDPSGLIAFDPSFNKKCLNDVKRALTLLKAFSAPKCDKCFRQIGDKRSLTKLLDDDRIRLQSESKDAMTNTGDLEMGFMLPGDKWNIHIRPVTCRLGRWQLAQTIAHELVHQTLGPAQGQENTAYGMEVNCGFHIQVLNQTITVVAK